jgi:hypothetical protein
MTLGWLGVSNRICKQFAAAFGIVSFQWLTYQSTHSQRTTTSCISEKFWKYNPASCMVGLATANCCVRRVVMVVSLILCVLVVHFCVNLLVQKSCRNSMCTQIFAMGTSHWQGLLTWHLNHPHGADSTLLLQQLDCTQWNHIL